eukprot:TRINITY_DN6600_c0_g1_i1.p1 TRINITY_DN6600_c0_g1~~TRINITY_DN6600_c0_g1_i1.p1  ORF type:complete len:249 (+),score=70.39 TRINITY_DN6600_c0_g1_i1:67-813(+)
MSLNVNNEEEQPPENANQVNNELRTDHSRELKDKNMLEYEELVKKEEFLINIKNLINNEEELLNKIRLTNEEYVKINCDCIVNAANEGLEGGGGIDQIIHKHGGNELTEACKRIPAYAQIGNFKLRCRTGDAKLTGAYNLKPIKYVAHTVGPYLDENGNTQPHHLKSCYNSCLGFTNQEDINSVAFCCISTGYYGYPMCEAAGIAISTTLQYINDNFIDIEEIIFCAYNDLEYKIYTHIIDTIKIVST